MLRSKVRPSVLRTYEVMLMPFGNPDGRTALEVAAQAGDWEDLRILTGLGADVKAVFKGAGIQSTVPGCYAKMAFREHRRQYCTVCVFPGRVEP